MNRRQVRNGSTALDLSKPVGLALGGGAARGWAHLGVLQALEEADVEIGWVSGTSIGALVGAFHAAGKRNALVELGEELNRIGVLRLMPPTVSRSGLLNGDRVQEFLRDRLQGVAFSELRLPFAAVAADLSTGEAAVLREGDVAAAIRASIAIPGLFAPLECDGKLLADGGLVNPLPIGETRRLGANQVIGVDLNYGVEHLAAHAQVPCTPARHPETGAEEGHPSSGASMLEQGLHTLWQRWTGNRQPHLFDILTASMVIIERSLTRSRLEMDPPTLLVRPDLGAIRLLEFHRAEETIERGYRATLDALGQTGVAG